MEGLKANTEQVWRSVKTWLKILASDLTIQKNLTPQDRHLLNELNLESPRVAARKCMLLGRIKPPCGWVKLNCDGSVRNNPGSSGGGGILRDASGNFKDAFTSHYSVGSNNRADLKALFDEIRLCKRLSYFNVIVESDSKIVVDWFRAGKCTLWYLCDFWKECIKEMQGMNVQIVHQFREGNQAADFLAKLGESGSSEFYEDLPRLLQGFVLTSRVCRLSDFNFARFFIVDILADMMVGIGRNLQDYVLYGSSYTVSQRSFTLGMGAGLILFLVRTATEFSKMKEMQRQMETLVKECKEIVQKKGTVPVFS